MCAQVPLICDSQHQLKMEKLISTYTNQQPFKWRQYSRSWFFTKLCSVSRSHWPTSTEVNPGAQMLTVSQIVNMFS